MAETTSFQLHVTAKVPAEHLGSLQAGAPIPDQVFVINHATVTGGTTDGEGDESCTSCPAGTPHHLGFFGSGGSSVRVATASGDLVSGQLHASEALARVYALEGGSGKLTLVAAGDGGGEAAHFELVALDGSGKVCVAERGLYTPL